VVVAPALEIDLMRRLLAILLALPAVAFADLEVVIIEGLGGDDRYVAQFSDQVEIIEAASRAITGDDNVAVFRSGAFGRDDIVAHFSRLAGSMSADDRLLLYLVGHGSYDEHDYKFNIAGPDLTDTDLVELLEALQATQLIVNTSSSSGAMLERLKHDNRTLIAATRSGAERHATRFGNYFAAALTDTTADLDKNELISAEEAFEFAARQVNDYYERNGQLATEHPRLEGEPGARFSLARLGTVNVHRDDPELTRLLGRRDALNDAIEGLRIRRDRMSVEDYQSELLPLMLELATVEEDIDARERVLGDAN